MPNGRGSVSCLECKHHWFHREPPDNPTAQMMCGLWKVAIPVFRYGTLNPFCRSFEPAPASHASLLGLQQHMDDGVLYGIFYNDVGRPEKLKRILDLRTKKFLDGHGDDWKAQHGYT